MSRLRRRPALIVLGALVALQVAALLIYRAVERSRTSASSRFHAEILRGDRPAPALELLRPDGSRLSLASLRGRPVLVHFWATWCPPCRDELPGLLAAARRHRDAGLVLLAVSVDEEWPVVRDYFAGQVPPEIVRAADLRAHQRYDVITLPDTYLVAPDGHLALRYGGARDWATADEHLAEILGDSRGSR